MIKYLKEYCHPNTLQLLDLDSLLKEEYFVWLMETVEKLYLDSPGDILPYYNEVFKVFSTDWTKAKVVILDEEPYFNHGIPTGLAYSTKNNLITPALEVIFRELERSFNTRRLVTSLDDWHEQGVILLNIHMTVEPDKSLSHSQMLWDRFTKYCLIKLVELNSNLIILSWGKRCKEFTKGLKCIVLESSHPISDAKKNNNKFISNNHFALANELLIEDGIEPIDWIGEYEVKSMYHTLYTDTEVSTKRAEIYNKLYDISINYIT